LRGVLKAAGTKLTFGDPAKVQTYSIMLLSTARMTVAWQSTTVTTLPYGTGRPDV
jgi:hypothetical protein